MSANEIFQDSGIDVNFSARGRHDLDFGKKWIFPERIENTFDEISKKIYLKSDIEIDDLKRKEKPKNVPMQASLSNSEEPKEKFQLKCILLNLENNLGLLEKLKKEGNSIDDAINKTQIGIDLLQIDKFESLFAKSAESMTFSSMKLFFNVILKSDQANLIVKKGFEFLDILSSPLFVGEIISEYFKIIVKEGKNC